MEMARSIVTAGRALGAHDVMGDDASQFIVPNAALWRQRRGH